MKKSCVLLCIIVSVYGRVTVNHEDIIKSNVISEKRKTEAVIAIVNDSINVILNKDPVPTTTENSSNKTCHDTSDIDNNIETDEQPCSEDTKEDNGVALLLTPYIEEGRLEEARAASRVDPKLFPDYESYSGFLTVDKEYRSHIFFWYFPAPKPVPDQPWMIWLQGGPGASSLIGLFDEVGPFRVTADRTLTRNPYSWLQNYSIVFIDNPVGSGYSFTEHPDGYVTDMATYAKHLYKATKQFLQIFPNLRTAPLYITGESYAGKYVPALGMEIHRRKDVPGGDINLKGLIIGNAYVEPSMISETTRPFINFGLLEQEQTDEVQPLLDGFHNDIAANRSVEAKQKWVRLITLILGRSHQSHGYNFLRDQLDIGNFAHLLRQSNTKRAIHVGDIQYAYINTTVNEKLAPDFLSNARPLFEELLEHYKVLAYCGQLDQMLPCAASAESYRAWKWSRSDEFLNATRFPYMLDRRHAGYFKSGGGMTWAVIRGAGHLVPMDAPRNILRLVSSWTRQQPLPTVPVPSESFVNNDTVIYL